jgi:hypothetical protein
MPATETSDAADGAEALVRHWANEVCQAPSVSAGDLARALRLDLGEARRLGRQRIFPALNGASRLEFVLGADAETVLFIEVATTPAVTVAELVAVLGPGRKAMPGPHQLAPTIIFDDVWPPGAPRGCAILARLKAGDHQLDAVDVVTLHPRAARARQAGA